VGRPSPDAYIAVICIVGLDPHNPSLQILTGLLGLTLGYFVGKGQDHNSLRGQ